jgi:hypothetical protein
MNKLQTLRKAVIALCFSIIYFDTLMAQFEDLGTVPAKIDFSHQLREWDGFGVNYIQTAHTRDYEV